jgi:hypothetical protein
MKRHPTQRTTLTLPLGHYASCFSYAHPLRASQFDMVHHRNYT